LKEFFVSKYEVTVLRSSWRPLRIPRQVAEEPLLDFATSSLQRQSDPYQPVLCGRWLERRQRRPTGRVPREI